MREVRKLRRSLSLRLENCKVLPTLPFYKGSYFVTYDESFRKINEVHENNVGVFKGVAGQYMTFIKGSYVVTFDLMFKKISERHV